MQAIRAINTSNFELSQVQTNLLNVLRIIAGKDIVDGDLLTDIAVGTTATLVSHKLGRKPLGYIVVGKNGPGDVYSTGSDSLTLSLTSTTAVTISIWVF